MCIIQLLPRRKSRSCFSGQSFFLPRIGCSTGKFTGLQPAPAPAAALQPCECWQRTSWLPVIVDPCSHWIPYSCIYRCIYTKGCLSYTSLFFLHSFLEITISDAWWTQTSASAGLSLWSWSFIFFCFLQIYLLKLIFFHSSCVGGFWETWKLTVRGEKKIILFVLTCCQMSFPMTDKASACLWSC